MEPQKIDTEKLHTEIQWDLYARYVKESGRRIWDGKNRAQGNSALAADLKELYSSFTSGETATQKKLDTFCDTWNVAPIKINDLYLHASWYK